MKAVLQMVKMIGLVVKETVHTLLEMMQLVVKIIVNVWYQRNIEKKNPRFHGDEEAEVYSCVVQDFR
jgi:hypothetical protein